MDVPVSGRSNSVENPLVIGLERDGRIEVRPDLVVFPGRSRVQIHGLRVGGGVRVCRVVAAAAPGPVTLVMGEGLSASADMPGRLLVRDSEGVEFVAFADECVLVGGRHASRASAARLRAMLGDPLR